MANLSSKTGTITTPVQTQISLSNNATTSVQDMSAYDSQEVTGFVYVDATNDLRCSFSVTVVKNGAGTYEVAAVDQSGDNYSSAPLLTFSMSSSTLRVTLPNVTGFASAYMRYQLSAPYLGGNYPLSVSASQVLGNAAGTAPTAGYIGEIKKSTVTTATNIPGATGTFADAANISITAGIWLVYGAVSIARNSATFSSTDIACGFNTTSGNSAAGLKEGINYINPAALITTTFTRVDLVLPPTLVRCDGTTITREEDSVAFASGTTLYLKLYVAAFSAATPQYTGKFVAIRIA